MTSHSMIYPFTTLQLSEKSIAKMKTRKNIKRLDIKKTYLRKSLIITTKLFNQDETLVLTYKKINDSEILEKERLKINEQSEHFQKINLEKV